jgi:4-amino-4-deoxy-L-arabinose transferase-like glycosyltransferase
VLSKYNYIILFVVLVFALWSLPEGRQVLADKRFVLSIVLLVLLLAPHLNWILHNQELAMRKVPQLVSPGKLSWVDGWLDGFRTLGKSLLAYVVPLYAGWTVVLRRLPARAELWPTNDPDGRAILFRRLLAFSLILYVAAIFLLRAKFKERWIQPNMYALPLVFGLGLAAELSDIRLKRFAVLAGIAASAVFLVLAGRVILAGQTGKPMRQNMPFRELAANLKRAGIQPATIIADTIPPAAAFRLEFPEARVLVPGQLAPRTHAGPQLVIWETDANAHTLEMLHELATERGIPREAFAHASVVEAPMKYFARRKLTMNYLLVPESTGSSRQTK